MKKYKWLLLLAAVILMILILGAFTQTPVIEPTQTPYIIYVVVTATPEPEEETEPGLVIQRPQTDSSVSLVNDSSTTDSGSISLVNNGTSVNEDDIIRRVVATMYAQSNINAGIVTPTPLPVSNDNQGVVTQPDGSVCTLSLEVVDEPTWQSGVDVPYGEVFWKEWTVRNTGTCTWTPDYYFVFHKGWQIGNTRFTMNKTTAPGETLTVRLGMTALLDPNRSYYSTYILEAPDGTQAGTITANYTVRNAAYFAPTATPAPKRPGPTGPSWWGGPYGPIPPWHHHPYP